MKELTLKEIQQESLKILLDVHRFCESNGIRYSLAYGTMIGAARHKGFIPWDNDIDIYMPRPDYIRFCHTYKSDQYGIISEYDQDCYINFCHIYEKEKTVAYTLRKVAKGFEGGVWIDVFPMDGAPDDHDEFEQKMLQMSVDWNKLMYLRKAACGLAGIKNAYTWKEALVFAFNYFLTPLNHTINQICKKLREEAQSIPFGSTGRWTDYSCIHIGDDNFHKIDEWDRIGTAEFEGHTFRMLQDYDIILRRRYGDYLQLPPESKRIPNGHDRFYWK